MGSILLWLTTAGSPRAVEPPAQERVGRVILTGNTRTADRSILAEIPVRPGAVRPTEADLLRAEIRLLVKYHRRLDLNAGDRPTIRVEANEFDAVYRDVRVSFPERPAR